MDVIRPKNVAETMLGKNEKSYSENTENWEIEKNSTKNDTVERTKFCFQIYT